MKLEPYPEYRDSGSAWLGRIPAHWGAKRLKQLVISVNEQTDDKRSDEIYLALEHVESWTGRLQPSSHNVEFMSQVKRFQANDVLFGRLRPYLAKVARPARPGVCTSEFLVLRVADGAIIPEFLEQTLRSLPFVHLVSSSSHGAKMPRANWSSIGDVAIACPPRDEQERIVRFVTLMDHRIARLVRTRQRLRDLLNEERQAVTWRAVMRGLSPNVRLRPSGISWLGDVPGHWQVWAIGRLAKVGNGSTPARGNRAYWANGGYPWLNSSSVNQGYITRAKQYVTDLALRECHLPKVKAGSVLVAITGQGRTRGSAALVAMDTTISQHIAYVTPHSEAISAEYLRLFLVAAYPELRAVSSDSGSTKSALTCKELKRFKVLVPPREEQSRIVRAARKDTSDIQEALARIQREMNLIREYRTRVNADVVMGRLDVRNAELPALGGYCTQNDWDRVESEEPREPIEAAEEVAAGAHD